MGEPRCERCGGPLPEAGGLEGCCPRCLMEKGLESFLSSNRSICPRCGAVLPAGEKGGECPSCTEDLSKETTATRAPLEQTRADPENVGPYRVLRLLGEGGMGIVYLAEQAQPLRRQVALKLMRPGLDSRKVIARFESERQALAVMNHPGVARVFDAGVAPDGRPYFAMEYVPGMPITEYCDRQRSSVRQRLDLFMQVCDAIQHSHQKGLLHRDIKPSNVLVMEQDGKPAVKVIDFGVAKAVSPQLTAETLFSEHGELIGTPAYISPEQAGTSDHDVDTRTDIYSLGVVLYELLAGALPHDPQDLKHAAAAEMLRIIREEEPPKPTTRIMKLGERARSVAQRRQTDVQSLVRVLRHDLDWITMRAIEKDPERRYASASELAADITRYLGDEPVSAGPPALGYRIRKFIRRHRIGVVAGLAITVALVLGTSISTALYIRAEHERERAQSEADVWEARSRGDRKKYVAAVTRAIGAHRRALGPNLQFASRVAQFVEEMPNLYAPGEHREWTREAIEIVERSIDSGDRSAVDILLQLPDEVYPNDIERLGVKAFDLLRKDPQNGRVLLGRVIELVEKHRVETAVRAGDLEVERLARQIVQLQRDVPSSADGFNGNDLWGSIGDLADILHRKALLLLRDGEPGQAEPVFREALNLQREADAHFSQKGTGDPYASRQRLLTLQSEFGGCLVQSGKFEEARPLLIPSYEQLNRGLGAKSAATQAALNRVIDFFERQGLSREAAGYRSLLPQIALREIRDFGPIGVLPVSRGFSGMSVPFNGRSTWILVDSFNSGFDQVAGWGWLLGDALNRGQARIQQSSASLSFDPLIPLTAEETAFNALHDGLNCPVDDCLAHYFLSPLSALTDPGRRRTLIFFSKMKKTPLRQGGAFGVGGSSERAGGSLAVWLDPEASSYRPEVQPERPDPHLLFEADEPEWGTATLVENELLYAYACGVYPEIGKQTRQPQGNCFLARVPLEQVLVRTAWQFYTGGGRWSNDWREGTVILGANKYSGVDFVHWNDYLGKFLGKFLGPFPQGPVLAVADRPEGPWESVAGFGEYYSVAAHPELARESGRFEYFSIGPRLVEVEFSRKGKTSPPPARPRTTQ
jgi:serine/threonine protein kinase